MQVKLPGQWSYTDCHFRTETSVATFIIHNFGSIEQIKQWVAAFMQQNKSKYVCRRTYQKRHKNMELCYKVRNNFECSNIIMFIFDGGLHL